MASRPGAGSPLLVLVGDRRRALRAARRSRLRNAQVVDDESAPTRREVDHRVVLSSTATDERWRAAVAELAALEPRAVLPLGESGVVLAARLRAALGLHEPDADPVATARRCVDKLEMKRAVSAAGIPCAETIDGDDRIAGPALAERLGVPFIVKPRVGSGGRGARWVGPGVPVDFVLPIGWIAERAIAGIEMSVEALIVDGRLSFVNHTEYLEPRWANVVPATLDPGERRAVRELLERVLPVLGVCDGFVHMELFLTARGPVFGELAWRPPGGHVMELIELAYGFDPWSALFDAACGRPPRIRSEPRRTAAVRLFHPGAGRVVEAPAPRLLDGLDGVERFRVRVGPGDRLAPRLGTGQEAAHVVVVGRDRDEAVARLAAAASRVRFRVEPD